ncbi:hypothetical protein ACFL6N_01645 [Thermodesulfobacteriota bacterium]
MNFDQQVSEIMSVGENFRYSRTWKEGIGTSWVYSPSLNADLRNEYFSYFFNANLTETHNTNGINTTTTILDNSWVSNVRKKYWPILKCDFSHQKSVNDTRPRSLDKETNSGGVNVIWSFDMGRISGGYSTKDEISRSSEGGYQQQTTEGYSASLNLNKSFVSNRLRLAFSQNYRRTTVEDIAKGTDQDDFSVTIAQAYAGVDTNPPANGLPPARSALLDTITTTPVVSIPAAQYVSVAFQTLILSPVHTIYLYTSDSITQVAADEFIFHVYVSPDGNDWGSGPIYSISNQPADVIKPLYESANDRFVLSLPDPGLESQYVKILISHNLASTVNFSELEIKRNIDVSSGIVSDEYGNENHMSNFSVSMRFTPDLDGAYNFTYENGRNLYTTSNDYTRTTHSGRLSWVQSQYLSSNVKGSETRNDYSSSSDSLTRNFSVDLSSRILPTLNASAGASKTESYTDSILQSSSYNYVLSSTAALYRDLDAGIGFRYNKNIHELENTEADTRSLSISATARINPKITTELSTSYSTFSDPDSESIYVSGRCNWRVSDQISTFFSTTKGWNNNTPGADNLFLSISIAHTRDIQSSIHYDYTNSSRTTQSSGMNVRWNINRAFKMSLNGNYHDSENQYSYTVTSKVIFYY